MNERVRLDLDVRLLRTLHLLLTESSVSRVAQILGQTQPAVSASLKRLRETLGDPLLVRSGVRLVPTERGTELIDRVGRILAELDGLFDAGTAFDPASARGLMRIATSTSLGVFLLPRIVEMARAEAPGLQIELCAQPADDALPRMLEQGEIDVLIGKWPDRATDLRFAPLIESETVCMVRPSHPLARATGLSMARYLDQDHISPSALMSLQWSPIDGRLAELGLTRRIVASVPEYGLVPYVLARSDMVFTTCRLFADHLAALMPFAVIDAPPEFGTMKFFLLWHERAHQSAANRWLRGLVRKAAAEVGALEPGAAADLDADLET
jgi:DNA-binding transcriptional LysR family regulator